MFNEIYEKADREIRSVLLNTHSPNSDEVAAILDKKTSLDLEELALILELGKKEKTENIIEKIRTEVLKRYRKNKNSLRQITPIYVSSYCQNKCRYCGYSSNINEFKRTRLGIEEFQEEVLSVIASDSKVVELVLGSDKKFSPELLGKYIKKTKEMLNYKEGSGILLCSDHFSKEDYHFLENKGLWGVVQWDETLDREKYHEWHKDSPKKSNFEERMNTHDKALSCGLEVATGFLFGLADYRYDMLMQITKARYLKKEYGRMPFVFGVPRLKEFGKHSITTMHEVDDKQFELALLAYKLAEPEVGRWLQTRETLELNIRNFLDWDVCTYSCGNVMPGGYTINIGKNMSQFKVNEVKKEEFEKELEKINFSVNYNWIEGG